MSKPVSLEKKNHIALITINNPPVNALGQAVRSGLIEKIEEAEQDNDVKAIIIRGEDKCFSAGADISEFGKTRLEPHLPDVCNRIEASSKPVVAAIHGTTLGGGFEVALSAHYRIALSSTKIGLPEVHLGILPGAGGTQRLPRIAGVHAALEMMTTGKPVPAKKGAEINLIDRLVEDKLMESALSFTEEIIGKEFKKSRDRNDGVSDSSKNEASLKLFRETLEKTARGLYSPFRIVDAVEAALSLPFDEGLKKERELFIDCMNSPQSKGLIHAFFSERKCAKFPESKTEARKLETVGVIGGGTMGSGITIAALDAGFEVTMVERDEDSIKRGQKNVEKVYNRHIEKGRMTEEQVSSVLKRYKPSTSFEDLSDVDMVIEAVFEEMSVKQGVFEKLDKVIKPGAVLASNTSYLDIDQLASKTNRPQDVIGLHFFSPANLMKLLEIVVPSKVSEDVVSTGIKLAKKMRKVPVRAGNCDGFIGNRILGSYGKVALFIMEDGATPYQIDEAIRDFGYPIGPFQMFDLAGGDIGWANRKRSAATRKKEDRYVHIPDRLCENGWFGQKTGRGYYLYEEGSRKGKQDPEVLKIIEEERSKKGIKPRSFTNEEVIERYLAAMINEASNVLYEEVATRPSDIDVVELYGYAFPRFRGGPMKYADMIGPEKVLKNILEFAKEDPIFWKPSPLLEKIVKEGKTFEDLN